jgi:asparagine synthase (glutamine-hydrolysing)
MCGIAGFVSSNSAGRDISNMVAALARRGPDGEGIETWPGVALGHRRLAIIDISDAGRQPMLSDDGRVGVVFNGCIYNFLDLRKDLETRGHRFRSRCDTEVLVRGYQQWGIDELAHRLRGMYAFGIWDQDRRTLYLVRDRLGVKPLLYAESSGGLAFASTLSALRAEGFGGDIDPDAILEFLEFGFVTDDRCVYRGVNKLPPATILEWRDGATATRCYWTLPGIEDTSTVTFEEAVERTEDLIVDSVRVRIQADVPIGALLSGGVDSALVCWALTKIHADITAFTITTPGDASDEGRAAAETAKILGIRHELVPIPTGEAVRVDELLNAFSEPFASQSALGMLRVSQAVKPFATVLLTGDGGDEIFGGYPFLYNVWRAEGLARKMPSAAGPAWQLVRSVVPRAGPLRRARNFFDYTFGGLGTFTRVRPGLPYFESRGLLGEQLRSRTLSQRDMAASAESARRLFSDVLGYHQKTHFLSEFLPKVDASTMYYALEARAPFLDQLMWEFASRLPGNVRFHGGRLKAILREIVKRRIHPLAAERRKQGFTVPVERSLLDGSRGMLESLAHESLLESGGFIRTGSLQKLVSDAIAQRNVPVQLWYLVVLEKWMENASGREPLEFATQSSGALS